MPPVQPETSISQEELRAAWNLKFSSPELETAFRHAQIQRSLRPMRLSLLAAIVASFGLGFLDLVAFPESYRKILLVRGLGVCLPSLLAAWVLLRVRLTPLRVQAGAVLAFLAALGLSAMCAVGRPEEPGTVLYFVGVAFPLAFLAFGVPMPFRWSFAWGVAMVATYPLAALSRTAFSLSDPLPDNVAAITTFQLLTLWLFLAVSGYVREVYERRDFVGRSLLRETTMQLANANSALRFAAEEKDTFLGIAAHDLRNPLAIVRANAEVLRDQQSLAPETARQLAGRVVVAAERMRDLLANLLDVNALETGKIPIAKEEVDLVTVVRNVLDAHEPAASLKDVRIEAVLPASAIVVADPRALMQVLDNLISNAIKYTPHGTKVTVTVEGRAVQILDEGPGFTEEDSTRLFEKFARLSARPTGGEVSTGLGLSIAKRLTDAMEGTLTLESRPGESARFRLAFSAPER
ncbi:MAG: HAMP domain-containing histidine kinase [Acidobacteria bacterium]|nr:HAMP domain-containing histidine kinase [Acidobacteriota bacterium]